MPAPLRVVQYGAGPIGLEAVRAVIRKRATGHLELVGVIDVDSEKVGKDVADLLGDTPATGVVVSGDADTVLADTRPDVVLHATSSFLADMYTQLIQCADYGCNVVSSTEELSFPYDRHPGIAKEIDEAATRNGVTVIGTGVNPGYAMDAIALMATGICVDVESVKVERVVDAGKRRRPLQAKVGAGIRTEEFERKKATGQFGHIGLRESLLLVADGLGWSLDRVKESLMPVLSDRLVETPFFVVQPGQVAGIHHSIQGFIQGLPRLSLDLKMYVGAEHPVDSVTVAGDPPVHLVFENGIFGDTATIAALVNTAPLAKRAAPGLKTVGDLPPLRAFATSWTASRW